ncbi:MAG: HAMP domain-containing histidine kinase [Bacteroidetes bacterium]|nr:HAMP domain-containing histidine kinase [Bacteroidota bacterium]
MKLFTKYNRINVAVTIVIFLLGSCLFYLLVHYIFLHQLDEALKTEQQEVLAFEQKHGKLPEVINTPDENTVYDRVSRPFNEYYCNRFVKYEKEKEWSRQIVFSVFANGMNYKVTVSKPLEETEDLLQVIIVVTVLLIALILGSAYFINRAVLNRLWRPFYNALDVLRRFKLDQKSKFTLEQSNIEEFDQLNNDIRGALQRVQADFESLNQFTAYAAHEMQTPLAVIRARLELLLQDETVFRNHTVQITSVLQAVRKLTKLHQSLLLLNKIENEQFTFTEKVRIDKIINHKLSELEDLINAKEISIEKQIQPVAVNFHVYLADILVGNLLNNAIRYNVKGGFINIQLNENELVVSNTSYLNAMTNERVFQRFFRSPEAKEEGNGLGLAIVKRICEAAGFTITYTYIKGMHFFWIAF